MKLQINHLVSDEPWNQFRVKTDFINTKRNFEVDELLSGHFRITQYNTLYDQYDQFIITRDELERIVQQLKEENKREKEKIEEQSGTVHNYYPSYSISLPTTSLNWRS